METSVPGPECLHLGCVARASSLAVFVELRTSIFSLTRSSHSTTRSIHLGPVPESDTIPPVRDDARFACSCYFCLKPSSRLQNKEISHEHCPDRKPTPAVWLLRRSPC